MKKTGPRRGPRTCTTYSALRYWLWIEPYTVRELAAHCDVTYTTAYKCIQKHAVRGEVLSAGDVCEDGKIMGLWKWSKSHPTTEGLLADALEHLAYAGHEEKAAELYDQFIAMCKK